MNKKHLSLVVFAITLSGLVACSGQQKTQQTDSTTTSEVIPTETTIPYRIAEAYFATSDTLPSVITTQEEQEKYLGMATTMGQHPTKIDWTKEFVIPVVLPSTAISTEIIPVSLVRDVAGELTFTYQIKKGEDLKTAEIRPFIAIIVSRDVLGPVHLLPQTECI